MDTNGANTRRSDPGLSVLLLAGAWFNQHPAVIPRTQAAKPWWHLFLDRTFDAGVLPAIRLLGHPAWKSSRVEPIWLLDGDSTDVILRDDNQHKTIDQLDHSAALWVSTPIKRTFTQWSDRMPGNVWAAIVTRMQPTNIKGWFLVNPAGHASQSGRPLRFFLDDGVRAEKPRIRVIGSLEQLGYQAPFLCRADYGSGTPIATETQVGNVLFKPSCLNTMASRVLLKPMQKSTVDQWGAFSVVFAGLRAPRQSGRRRRLNSGPWGKPGQRLQAPPN